MHEKIASVARLALINSYMVHNQLGESGLEEVMKNQFGETALKADYECEEAVIETFRQSGCPIRIHSEEHGIVNFGKRQKYLAVLDGIDGTARYKSGKDKYATLLGVYRGVNPTYDDFLFSGIMQHSTGNLFLASPGKLALIENIASGSIVKTSPTEKEKLSQKDPIYVDEYFDINKKVFSSRLTDFNINYLLCSAMYYAELLEGNSQLVLECTRKGNLELAAVYGLIIKSGGVMVTLNGEGIGSRRFRSFGQGANEHIPVITAANPELAVRLLTRLNQF